jgi:hypothetical protein
MSDATFKNALRELREDLDRLRADLENEIAGIVGVDEYAEDDIILEEDGKVSVDVAELKALFERLDYASGEADDAFTKFDQEVDRAWRRFKHALVHSKEGASA